MSEFSPSIEPEKDHLQFQLIEHPQEQLLTPEAIQRYGLAELITKGYDMPAEEAEEQVRIEYKKASVVMLALDKEGKAVGSLGYVDVRDDEQVQPFWESLSQEVPMQVETLHEHPVLHTQGFVVNPDLHEKNIGRQLLDEVITRLQPSIILGETKNPAVAAARSRGAEMHGYRTFYGNDEITPGSEHSKSEDHLPLLRAYAKVLPHLFDGYMIKIDDSFIQDGVFGLDTRLLNPNVPEAKGRLEQSFVPVVEKQKELDNKSTAVATLFTVSPRVLPRKA